MNILLWTAEMNLQSSSARHYSEVIMSAMASPITGVSSVYSTVCSGADQIRHQSSASLAFVRGIHRGPVNSPNKGPVTRKKFLFHDVIMWITSISTLWMLVAKHRVKIQYKPIYGIQYWHFGVNFRYPDVTHITLQILNKCNTNWL